MDNQRRDSYKSMGQDEINVIENPQIKASQDENMEEQKNELIHNQSLYSDLANNEQNNSLFPSRQNLPRFWRWGHKADIFNFEPVPKSGLVSSRRSQIASVIVIFLMLLFIGYTIYDFFFNNTPRLNQYSIPIDFNQQYKVQDFAFGFYEMDTSSTLIEDPSIFTYYLEQYVYSNKPGDVGHEDLSFPVAFEYCTPKWAPVQIKMFCPKDQLYMQGMIGKGDFLKYPRIKILACDSQNNQGIACDKQKAISEFPKGRLFIFIKQDEQINFATDDVLPESGIFYYYFIVPNLYDRAETIIGSKKVTKFPNYGSTFKDTIYNYQNVVNNNLYVSDVSYFFQSTKSVQQNSGENNPVKTKIINTDQFNLKDALKKKSQTQQNFQQPQVLKDKVNPTDIQPYFAWWMSISPNQIEIEVTFKTSANMISLWGGLWGVLQAAFTFIYMTYNAKQFYQQHKEWDRFDNVIRVNRLSTFIIDESDADHKQQVISTEQQQIGDSQINDQNKKISINN